MLKFQTTKNGLRIYFDGEIPQLDKVYHESDFSGMLEDLMGTSSPFCNGWHFEAGDNPSLGLTQAPFITNYYPYNDDGEFYLNTQEPVYYYSDYMLHSFIDILMEYGEVFFKVIN